MSNAPHNELNVEAAVRDRYSDGARAQVHELCCPVDYNTQLLEIIPQEIIDRDYGCGDPSAFVQPGDTVLDLGSGGGKICYIAAQICGRDGRVLGVDINDEMLALARKHQPTIVDRLGYDNVEFLRGRIQDLALDVEALDAWIAQNPVRSAADLMALEDHAAILRRTQPLVPDASVDIVLSNCVLNLVRNEEKQALFREIFRVLAPGGRAAISDIVSDEAIPLAMQQDPELWSGCISGAYEELAFLEAFRAVGFEGVEIVRRSDEPWRVVEGIEFRSATVLATRPLGGPCLEHNQAVIYRGPFSEAQDDDGHTFVRGVRTAVCGRTFAYLKNSSMARHFYFIEPREAIEPGRAAAFDCSRTAPRHPRETKGKGYDVTTSGDDCCGTNCC